MARQRDVTYRQRRAQLEKQAGVQKAEKGKPPAKSVTTRAKFGKNRAAATQQRARFGAPATPAFGLASWLQNIVLRYLNSLNLNARTLGNYATQAPYTYANIGARAAGGMTNQFVPQGTAHTYRPSFAGQPGTPATTAHARPVFNTYPEGYDPDVVRAYMWRLQNQGYPVAPLMEQLPGVGGGGGGGYYPYYGGGGGGGGGTPSPNIPRWLSALQAKWTIG